jgi:glycosyltransferase involved in cell wall biosynthesis
LAALTTISVALATFNGQKFLGDQLRSLAAQDTLPHELVVSDDGSSDGTIAMLRQFAQTAPFPVRLFQNQIRLGHRANFVRAAGECNGDLIAFCDQDDVWQHQKLELMRKAFADPQVMLAYHNSRLIDERGAAIGLTQPRLRRGRVYGPLATAPWKIIVGHSQVLRRSLTRFDRLHPESIDPFVPKATATHDYWYSFWASVLGKIVYVPKVLVDYRQHDNNASGWPYRTLAAYLIDNIVNAESYVIASISGAENRLHLLHRSRNLLEDKEIQWSDTAARAYESMLRRHRQRSEIYRQKRLADRARCLLTLLRDGTYFNNSHRDPGLDALLLDTFIGVLCPPVGRLMSSAK